MAYLQLLDICSSCGIHDGCLRMANRDRCVLSTSGGATPKSKNVLSSTASVDLLSVYSQYLAVARTKLKTAIALPA